jgi:hypothetical protein
MNLPKESFLALAAVGWVDGSLQKVEATGLLRAAKEAGVTGDDLVEIEKAAKNKTTLDDIELGGMTDRQQVMTYALAAWFAALDGVISTSEHTTLVTLGDKLGLAVPLRARAAVAANDIACEPAAGRPDRFDFQKLDARLRERLPQIKD